MNKFSFPVNNPEPKPEPLLVKSLDDYLYKVQAIMLFNNIIKDYHNAQPGRYN